MRTSFDRRVVSEEALRLVRACQTRIPCHLGGGAALSGAYLGHRLSNDLDLFCHREGDLRGLFRDLPAVAREAGISLRVLTDAGTFVRAQVTTTDGTLELDLVQETVPDIEPPPPPIDGVIVESLADLRANKITCILSRSEPRDLVDLLFLEREGYRLEDDLSLALRKDAGIDPGILAWLLGQFPVEPLPQMLFALTKQELLAFRDDLRERLRKLAVPPAT
jgi:hypothetical protein